MKSMQNVWTKGLSKRLIALVVSLVMILSLLPAGLMIPVQAAEENAEQTASACICGGKAAGMEGHTCQDITQWTDWGDTDAEKKAFPSAAGSYRLVADIHVQSQKTMTTGTVNLDLNGYTITVATNPGASDKVNDAGEVTSQGSYNCFREMVLSGGTLNITDSVGTGKMVTGKRGDGGLAVRIWAGSADTVAGTLNLFGGTLDGSNTTETTSSSISGVVEVANGGTFNMYGGTVIGASWARQYAKGENGDIIGNAVVNGGAVCVYNGSFNMYGGEIYGGAEGDGTADNVFVYDKGVAKLAGGTIYGGVNVAVNDVTVCGSAKVLDCDKNGNTVNALTLISGKTLIAGTFTQDADIRIEYMNGVVAVFADDAAEDYNYAVSVAKSRPGDLIVVPNADGNLAIAEGKIGCVCGGKAVGMTGHTCQKVIWKPLNAVNGTVTLSGAAGNYYLTSDSSAKQAEISGAYTVSLDLNGYTITMVANPGAQTATGSYNYWRAYVVNAENAVLNITDSVGGGKIVSGVRNDAGSLIRLMKDATVNLYGGILDGSNTTQTVSANTKGPVEMQSGTFNMYGGKIIGITDIQRYASGSDNTLASTATVEVNGAAVSVTGASFNLYDGEIVGGKVNSGGGVIISNGSFKMYGGTVTGGAAINGGGLYVKNGTIEVHGGKICGSTATYGGSVYVNSASTFVMDGGEIYGGTAANGANLFIGGNANGSASITGGTVYGGVRTTGATLSVGGSAKILDVTKDGAAISSLECAGKVTFTALNSDADIKVEGAVGALNAQFAEGAAATFVNQIAVGQVSQADKDLYVTADLQIVEGKFGCICGGNAVGVNGHICENVEWTPLTPDANGKVALPNVTGNYYLTADAALGQQGVIDKANQVVNFDLNGHTVTIAPNTGAQTATGSWNYQGGFVLNGNGAGSVLNITDSVGGGKLVVGTRYPSGAAIRLLVDATVNLYGGILDGSNMTQSTTATAEGIVKLENGIFNMYAGQIIGAGEVKRYATGSGDTLAADTSVTVNGGAVTVGKGTFNMYGGTISGTTQQTNGGNVYVTGTSSVFNMYGGVIENGSALLGGNVSAINSGIFNMYGGTIENGEAGSGGNVYIKNSGLFNLYSGTVQGGKAANCGGNIYVDSTGTLQMLAQENLAAPVVTNGQAREGGNIDLRNGGSFLMTTGTVSYGVADATNYGGNLYVNAGSAFSMTGGEIYGGTAGTGPNVFIGGNAGGSASITGGTIYGQIKTTGTTLSIGGNVKILDVEKDGTAVSALECGNTVTILALGANADVKVEGAAGALKAKFAEGAADTFNYQITVGQLSKGDSGLIVTKGLLIAEAKFGCVCGGLAEGMEGHTCEIVEWLPWNSTNTLPASGNYYLTADIENAKQVGISQLSLDLNGHSIRMGSNPASARGNSYRVFALEDDSDYLNITDSSENQTGVIYAGERHDCGHIVYILGCSATFNLYGGTLSGEESMTTNGNQGNLSGIVYSTEDGTFNMYGGTIIGLSGITHADPDKLAMNRCQGVIVTGAAVTISGTFNMYGGTIRGGDAVVAENLVAGDGGNVYILPDSTFNMYGGEILGGNAQYGGNVYIGARSTFNQVAGTISGGTASADGNDIFYADGLTYAVVFTDWDGTVLSEQTLCRGEMPAYEDLAPAREDDGLYIYTFLGWTPEVNYATGDVTYVATYDKTVAEIISYGITLSDDLTMKFLVKITDAQKETAYVKIAVAGGEAVSYPASAAQTDGNGNCIFAVNVAAAQMTDIITLQLVVGDVEGAVHEYSVVQYAQSVLGNAELSAYHALVKEMLAYGAAAQTYFGYNTDNTIDPTLYEGAGANEIDETQAPAMNQSGAVNGVQFYGATLLFKSKIAVRLYFTGNAGDCTFLYGDKTLTPVQKNGMWHVEIADINPQDLDETITVTVNGTLSVTYSPMNYMVRMGQKGDDNLKALLKAMYNYHVAAEALVENA